MAEQRHQMHLLSPYIEGELSSHERKLVKLHLDTCASCRHELSLLRQTIDALEELPLEKTSVDFLEKLHRRVERDTRLYRLEERHKLNQHIEEQSDSLSRAWSFATLPRRWLDNVLPQVLGLRRFLFFPLHIKIPIYTTAAGLALTVFLVQPSRERVPSGQEKVARESTTTPSSTSTPPAAPLSQKVADVVAESVRPVGDSLPVAEQPTVSSPPLASREAGFSMVKPVMWRLAGSQPEALREQVEVLAHRMADAVVVQEGENILVISLLTQKLAVFRQEVSKLGQLHVPYEEAKSSEQTTVLHITFAVTFAHALRPLPPPNAVSDSLY